MVEMNRMLAWFAVFAAALLLSVPPGLHAAAASRPNVIFILADDLGWRDLGCFGSTFHETPNIDRLAARGIRFTQAYAANPLCSPTRSSILTGQYPARIGITAPVCHEATVRLDKRLAAGKQAAVKVLNADSLTRLKPDYFTLAEALKEAGYATAHFGKWHLGHNLPKNPDDHFEPKDQGFDLDFPHTPNAAGPGGGYLAPWKFIKDPAITGKAGEHIEDRLSVEAAKFIQAHKDQPFFVNYWAYSVHSPWNARRDYLAHFQPKADGKNPQHNPLYAAMVKSLDDGVGRLLAAVDEAGIADRTIIIFFSDNGGWAYPPKTTDPEGFEAIPATSNLPLRSGKASIYEGGTREPGIVVWPGHTKAGASTDALFSSVDWYPTILAMCGLKPRPGLKLDGLDQTPAILGQGAPRDRVFVHFPHGSAKQAEDIPGFLPSTFVRRGDWKLIRFFADNDDGSDRFELYNLKTDLGETTNLAAAKPELVKDLNGLITEFLADTEAVVPKRNPNYKPGATAPAASVAKPGTADPLQGWKARNCTATVKDGILLVTASSPDPFLGFAPGKLTADARLRFRLRCDGGTGRVEWVPGRQGGNDLALKPVSYALNAGEWAEIGSAIPASPNQPGILRLHLPVQTDVPVELDWIELVADGKTRRWDF